MDKNMRDNLIDLLNTELQKSFDYVPCYIVVELADRLIEKGVILNENRNKG